MFIPVMDEEDIYDANGNQIDDINTVIEYIDQVVLGHKPKPHPDPDDDQAHFFNVIKIQQFVINPVITINTHKPDLIISSKPVYSAFIEAKPSSVSYDVIAPPPKIC